MLGSEGRGGVDWSLCFHVACFNKNKNNKKLAMA